MLFDSIFSSVLFSGFGFLSKVKNRKIASHIFSFLFLCIGSLSVASAACTPTVYKDKGFVICTYDAASQKIGMFWKNPKTNQPFGNLNNLAQYLESQNKTLLFATNGGMFNTQLAPIGLYIEDGKTIQKINTRDGGGNFHLKPNGVFYITKNGLNILETKTFIAKNIKPLYATQSGPMLVINGNIHPDFSPNSTSFKVRNGIGVSKDGKKLYIVASTEPISFYTLAALFKDQLHSYNALFLDGSLSTLYYDKKVKIGGWFDVGPMIGVYK